MKWRQIGKQRYQARSGTLSAVVAHNGADYWPWAITLSWTAERPQTERTLRAAQAVAADLLDQAAWTLAQPKGN